MKKAFLAAVVLLFFANPAFAQFTFSPSQTIAGLSSGNWSAQWWQYILAIPASSNPVNGNCPTNPANPGPVVFLGGPASGTLQCVVPAGKPIFFPIINDECSTNEGLGTDAAQLTACTRGIIDAVGRSTLRVTLDHVSLVDPAAFRAASPSFDVDLPTSNIFGATPGAGTSVSDGYWVMLQPLSAGSHTLHYTGCIPAFSFCINTTYQLTAK